MKKINKEYCNKIKLPVRDYKDEPTILYTTTRGKNRYVPKYYCELLHKKGAQIIRLFGVKKDGCRELLRIYIYEGEVYCLRRTLVWNTWANCAEWDCYSPLSEKSLRLDFDIDKFVSKRIQPLSSLKFIKNDLPSNDEMIKDFNKLIKYVRLNQLFSDSPIYESLYKIDPLLHNSILYKIPFERLRKFYKKFGRSLQLVYKFKYDISEYYSMYFDYLDELYKLKKDIRSPKYLCPKDFYKAHSKTSGKVAMLYYEKQLGIFNQEKVSYLKRMSIFKSFNININGLKILPLLSHVDVYIEGKIQHHCLNSRYSVKTALLFTSYYKGDKAESIEYDLSTGKVKEARAAFNKQHHKHNEIVKICNEEITKFLSLNKIDEDIDLNIIK